MTGRRDHIDMVDYLRGLAALMVTWFHLTNGYGATWPAYSGFYGWLGVEIFFVISGFVITLSLSSNERLRSVASYGEFMVKRIVRLEPPYIASVLMTVGLLYLSARMPGFRGEQPDVTMPQLAFHLAYLIPFTPYLWLQPVYWTLTYEFFFYLVGGMAIPFVMAQRGSTVFGGVALSLAGVAWLGWLPPLVLLFVVGIAACRAHLRRDPLWVSAFVGLVATATMALGGMMLEAGVGLLAGTVLAGCVYLPAPPAPVARLLSGFGTISYSLYLVHVPIGGRVINLGRRWMTTPVEHFALSVAALLLCCIVATAFWWAIERPSIAAAGRYARRLRARRGG